ncbi:MAG: polyribonucleotide nucleotidyltransferase [Candidatus Latescibacteria bacterium]|nr:polyribonucleotide nucleotidyltransferase [Candidatus Latescibacterota bacterium]
MIHKVQTELGGRTFSMETGRIAKQANSALWVQHGDTVVMVTACRAEQPNEDRSFLPLTVEYREKSYAAGRIPGSIFKREGRPLEKETLSARLTDHPLRPTFPKEYAYETQVYITILSADGENDADVLGMVGASAALCISDIPFEGPLGSVRVGRIGGELVVNPTFQQLEESDIELIVTCSQTEIVSVEGGAHEISEAEMMEALRFAHAQILPLLDLQRELAKVVGKKKLVLDKVETDPALIKAVEELAAGRISKANRTHSREERQALIAELTETVQAALAERYPGAGKEIDELLYQLTRMDMRRMVLKEKKRVDGRELRQVRPVSCENSVLPRTHGSAIFQRGHTQALCVATLGSKMDERMVDDLRGKTFKSYFLDYNFPPFSTGEVRRETGPRRREIGHGHLAERAIEPVIPAIDAFPYTIRLVSDILESNGSTSMATVCGCSLALMDAGIPIKSAVSGAGVGLVKEGDEWELLTDIQGTEDFLGDMDFKVAGTKEGITAIQLDIKIRGITFEIMEAALERAREARFHIMSIMDQCIAAPRQELSKFAPRILFIRIDPSKIGAVIGPGGKMIREIEKTGASINVEDDGTITIASVEASAAAAARRMIEDLTSDAEIGRIYNGTVKRIMPFGAFVEILPGKEGLLHISELDHRRVEKVEDVVEDGQRIEVKVIDIDNTGKIRLSHKAILPNAKEKKK